MQILFQEMLHIACTVSGGSTPGSGITNPAAKNSNVGQCQHKKLTAQALSSKLQHHNFNITNSSWLSQMAKLLI